MSLDIICLDVFDFENRNDFRNYETGHRNTHDLITKLT